MAERGDAIDELKVLFNAMLDRIEGLVRAMRETLDNVSHDLRTPLARLKATAERALAADRPDSDGKEALADMLEETDRAAQLLSALMDVSEAETGVLKLKKEPVAAADLVAGAIALFEDAVEEKGVALSGKAEPGLLVLADRNRMRQALANLLDNAVKHTPSGGRIIVDAMADGPQAVFRVSTDPELRPATCRTSSTASTAATRAAPSAAWVWASPSRGRSWKRTAEASAPRAAPAAPFSWFACPGRLPEPPAPANLSRL